MRSLALRSLEAVREATPEHSRRKDFGVLLKEFSDVQVVDSTSLLLKWLARDWAPSTSKVKPAGVKWHAISRGADFLTRLKSTHNPVILRVHTGKGCQSS